MRERRTESRENWGFYHVFHGLQSCALRADSTQEFDPTLSTLTIESLKEGGPLSLEVSLDLDASDLLQAAQLQLDEGEFMVAYSNTAAKRFSVLASWPASRVPKTWQGTVAAEDLNPGRSEVQLLMVLREQRVQRGAEAWRKGSILAQRSFGLVYPDASTLFTVNWTSFSVQGWPENALWKVEFRVLEGFDDLDPEEVVSVHVNKDLPALVGLLQPAAQRDQKLAPFARALVPLLIAGITCELVTPVLRWLGGLVKEDAAVLEGIAEDSLAGRVLEAVKKFGLDAEQAIGLAELRPQELSVLLQDYFEVGRALDQKALDRMQKK